MSYAVKEIFYSIQGEGAHAGSPMVFVRFSGCNVWSGREEDRGRDAAKGNCAAWCDTAFRGTDGALGGRYSAEQIAKIVRDLWSTNGEATVVLTGGEPLLQVDTTLVDALHEQNIRIHVETNGSIRAPRGIDWITVSPKPPMHVVEQHYDEVKLVLAIGVDPCTVAGLAKHRFLQPVWDRDDIRRRESERRVIDYVKRNQNWRVSLQTHKILEVQ